MKKISAMILAVGCMFIFAACGGEKELSSSDGAADGNNSMEIELPADKFD